MRNFLLFGLCFFLCYAANAQVNIFVSPRGSSHNPGTFARPLQTLEQALRLAENRKGNDVAIWLRGGTYYLNRTLVIRSDEFVPGSLKIEAWKSEQVFISAGARLHLKWRSYKGGIYVAEVPDSLTFERLYINGRLQVLARYPNYDPAAGVYNGTAADALSPERVKRWKDPVGGYVHAIHASEWGSQDYLITGASGDGKLQLEGGWQNNRPSAMHKQKRFVENIFEELDTANEWYLDRAKHLLYYYPPQGADLKNARVEVSRLKNSLELRGTAINPLKNVRLRHLNFIHNERSFMDTKEPLLRSDWTIYRGGAVLMDGTQNCRITDCTFTGLGGNAIMVSDYNKRDTINGCLIDSIGASAICFVGDPKAVRSPSFRNGDYVLYDQMDKTPGPLTNDYPRECLAADNLIHNIGRIEKQATGVEIDMASQITVSHNSIYNTPRAGINIGDGCWGGHIIEYNDVFNTVLETGDHGSFNSWGRDRYWSADRNYMDSLVAVHPEMVLWDAQKQNIIRNNRFRCDHGWDIDLDDGSSNYHIYDNVCLNGGLKLREGFYRIAANNITINNSFHPHVWFKNSGDAFEHNIVMAAYKPIGINYWGDRVDSNLFTDPAGVAAAQKNGTDRNSVVAAANAIFPGASRGNYTVPALPPVLKIGFHNFPMNEFGVQKPSLRKLAMQPVIPVLRTDDGPAANPTVFSWKGGSCRNVSGLGDRSVFGLPDETGVVVLSGGKDSAGWGLMKGDVIRSIDGRPVKDVKALKEVSASVNKRKSITVGIFRNQQPMELPVSIQENN
jgi:hypothetical protein